MRPARRGVVPTLGLGVALVACAHSVASTSDRRTIEEAGNTPASTSTSSEAPASSSPTATGSSGGSDMGPYDAGPRRDAEAGTDSGSAMDASIDSGDGGQEASAPCTAQSCSTGCCDTGGRCAGMLDTACGNGGSACVDCTLTGGTCKAGSCMSGSSSSSPDGGRDAGGGIFGCNLLTCFFGCCKGATCMFGTAADACGTFASACQDCTATQQACSSGTCN